MGRGGGGGGSHHSSHHSSSHSHSSRSSGSSYRSSGSSYRSSGSSYRSSGYSSSHHSGHYSSGGLGGYSSYNDYGSSRSGCSGGLIGVICFLCAFFGILFGVIGKNGGELIGSFSVERSTINREMLPSDKCTKSESWYRDDWGDWIDEPGEREALIQGLTYFYERTGVQPYVWIMGEEGKDYMSEGSVEELAESKYKQLFGDDEGHLLLIFREYPNESSNYIVTATPGYDAETVVMDEQAREILLDYIDLYYTSDRLNEGEFFSMAFRKATDRIMTKQLSNAQLITIGVVVLIVVIGLIVIAKIRKKRKVAVAKEKAVQAQAEASKKQTEFDRKKYEDRLEKEYVSVECPNCAYAGNKIRKSTVGNCPYCGTAIMVDKDGKVEFGTAGDKTTT